jgi:hypothetical protein
MDECSQMLCDFTFHNLSALWVGREDNEFRSCFMWMCRAIVMLLKISVTRVRTWTTNQVSFQISSNPVSLMSSLYCILVFMSISWALAVSFSNQNSESLYFPSSPITSFCAYCHLYRLYLTLWSRRVFIIFKNSVRTSKRTPHFTITKINWLMLF